MTRMIRVVTVASIAAVVAAAAMIWSVDAMLTSADRFVSTAEARVGRPLTPMSYAGVARRTTRRAVAAGAVVGGVAASGCVQVADAYGQIVTRCY